MSRETGNVRTMIGAVAMALLTGAVVRELSMPRDRRTWHGALMGVPYDLRRPTVARLRESWWAPDDPRLLTPRLLGVGWSLNLGRLFALARTLAGTRRTLS